MVLPSAHVNKRTQPSVDVSVSSIGPARGYYSFDIVFYSILLFLKKGRSIDLKIFY